MVRVAASPGSPRSNHSTPKLRRKVPEGSAKVAPDVIQRLVEYFVVVSSRPRWTESSTKSTKAPASPGNDSTGNIHMPADERNTQDHTFQPKITARYPQADYPDNPLNPMIPQFCFPHSDYILPSSTFEMPRIHYFVLTNDKGRKLYGTCLTVYEEYFPSVNDPYSQRPTVHNSPGGSIELVVEDGKTEALYIPRVLCILSTWPYLLAFREYLRQLYRISTLTDLMQAPLERYIQNLCVEIPAPPPGAFEIEMTILDTQIKFWAPPANQPIAYVALPYSILFECLDLDSILVVWYALLMEQKVILVSSQHSILTVCAEILQSLLFPLQWSHLYIPLLPRFLSPMLDAPIPYLCGVIRENWPYAEENLSAETIVVDLDTNTVDFGSHTPRMASPPLKKWNKLKLTLEEAVGNLYWKTRGLEHEYNLLRKGRMSKERLNQVLTERGMAGWKEKLQAFDQAFGMAYMPDSINLDFDDSESEQSIWERVQEGFLRFFASSLKSHRKFLHVPKDATTTNNNNADDAEQPRWNHTRRSFDRDGYVAWQKEESKPFYREFCGTQHFDDFITKCLYSPGEPDIIFFDQTIDSKLNRSKLRVKKLETPFLLNAKAHKVLKTVKAVEPSNEGIDDGKVYRYPTWPETFDASLFGESRPIPGIITAEFDRQASLVARLRAINTDTDEKSADGFSSVDFDPSPEVAAFTTFFFTYCAIVGFDWQSYQQKSTYTANITAGSQQDKLSEKSTPVTVATAGVTEPDEAILHDECHGTLFGDSDCLDSCMFRDGNKVPSGMILDVPDMCSICDDYTKDVDIPEEFMAQWGSCVNGRTTSNTVVEASRSTSLLDMDTGKREDYEEKKAIAIAQLDLAFDALTTVPMRGLNTDPDAFKSLMEACGRCGSTERAVELIQIMKRDGFVADREIYSCFMHAFARDDNGPPSPTNRFRRRKTDAYSAFLNNKLQQSKAANEAVNNLDDSEPLLSCGDDSFSDGLSSGGSSSGTPKSNPDTWTLTDIYNAVFPYTVKTRPKRKKKKNKRRTVVKNSGLVLTDRALKQVVLGESLLTHLYPDLFIDSQSNSCPQCSTILMEDDVVGGWSPCNFQDFTTECPQCRHRFVPTFTVQCSSPDFNGTQGRSTPLYCEFLSPWVLRKELEAVINGPDGIEGMLAPNWRDGTDIRATLWWNLIVTFRRFRLPLAFLLQGSFQNQLDSPLPNK